MTLAAAELGVTHGAISRQVKLLEEMLGTPLLDRTKAGLRPTPAGSELLASLEPAFNLIQVGVSRVGGAANRLPVACHSTLIAKWLIPRLSRFRAIHPEIAIQLREMAATDSFVPGVKVAIRLVSAPVEGPYIVTPLMPIEIGLVLTPALAASVDDVLQLPRLASSSWSKGWAEWAALSGHTFDAKAPEHIFGRIHYMLDAAIAGLGVAIATWLFVAEDVAAGRLIAPFGFVRSTSVVAAITPSSGVDRATRQFIDWLREEGSALSSAPHCNNISHI